MAWKNIIKVGTVFIILSLFLVGCSDDFEGKWTLSEGDGGKCGRSIEFIGDNTLFFKNTSVGDVTGTYKPVEGDKTGEKYTIDARGFTLLLTLKPIDDNTLYMNLEGAECKFKKAQ